MDEKNDINRTIAEWMGFVVFRPSEVEFRSQYDKEVYEFRNELMILPKGKKPQTHMIDARTMPNYYSDLNAVREAELKFVTERSGNTYCRILRLEISENAPGTVYEFELITAPASVRATAIAKAIEEK